MDKKDRFIAEPREIAKLRGLAFHVTKSQGMGGHAMVGVGLDKRTTLPSREIDPKTASKIKKPLGLD